MLKKLKNSLEQNEITLSTALHTVKEYLSQTQNEMTILDAINCYPEFDTEVRSLDLSEVGRKLVVEIVLDNYNPFQYDRAISNLISKIEHTYECDIEVMTLSELMFLVVFAHIYLGEVPYTKLCEENEAVKWINFGKSDLFVYRNIEDDIYCDGYIFEGTFNGHKYEQAYGLIKNGWATEVWFIDNGQQITCYKNSKNTVNGQPKEQIMIVEKYDYENEVEVYPQNYFAFRTYPTLKELSGFKDMKNLSEVMNHMLQFPSKYKADLKSGNLNQSIVEDKQCVLAEDEELLF